MSYIPEFKFIYPKEVNIMIFICFDSFHLLSHVNLISFNCIIAFFHISKWIFVKFFILNIIQFVFFILVLYSLVQFIHIVFAKYINPLEELVLKDEHFSQAQPTFITDQLLTLSCVDIFICDCNHIFVSLAVLLQLIQLLQHFWLDTRLHAVHHIVKQFILIPLRTGG